jgi:tetratricopeptide (TPR) repeat protein
MAPLVAAGATTVFLAVALSGYLFFHPNKSTRPLGRNSVKARRSVAVLGFKNLAGKPDLAWLSTALSEMLTTELAAGEQLRTIPGESVAQMKINLALPEAHSYSKETLAKIRQNLGTDELVLGSYVPMGNGMIRVDLRLQDAVAGETLASVSEKGSEAQLDELVGKAGAELRAKLGVGGLSESQSAAVKTSLPSSAEAARYYAEGLGRLRVYDNLGARGLLQKAVALEPNFALSHGALATAWQKLGYDAQAKQEAQKAYDLSVSLSREERLLMEARYRESTNDWDKAVETYRTLFNFFPDNLEYGLQLARAQGMAGKGKEAIATTELLRNLPPPQRDDPRIDLVEDGAARSLGDFRRVEDAAARAVAKGQAQGAQLVIAQARLDQCTAFRHLGEPKKATAACEEAERAYATTGNQSGRAGALNNIANNYYDQGDLAGAKRLYEQTLATCRQIGNQRGIAGALDNLANVLGDLGNLDEARKLSEQALEIYREIGDYTGMGETLNNIAAEQTIEGDIVGATKTSEQSLEIWRKIGDKNGEATTLNNLGEMLLNQGEIGLAMTKYQSAFSTFRDMGENSKSAYPLSGMAQVLFAQGDLGGAKEKYDQVPALCREANDKHESAEALFGLGDVFTQQGDLAAARQRHEEAATIRKEIGEKGTEAASLLALAALDVEQGKFSNADTLARKALDEFQAEKLRQDEFRARVMMARSLLAQGKPAEAKKQLDPVALLAARTPYFEARMNYAITSACIKGATGSPAEAARSLEASLAEAIKHGHVGLQYEARLALAETEMKSGNLTAGRARLEVLEKDARANGFLLIARKATAPSRTPS